MIWSSCLYWVPLLVVTIAALALAVLAWRRRPVAGSRSIALLMVMVAEWALTAAFEIMSPTEAGKLFWVKCEYLAVVSLPIMWLAFILRYSDSTHWLSVRNLVLASIIPVITLALLWTTGYPAYHHHPHQRRSDLDSETFANHYRRACRYRICGICVEEVISQWHICIPGQRFAGKAEMATNSHNYPQLLTIIPCCGSKLLFPRQFTCRQG